MWATEQDQARRAFDAAVDQHLHASDHQIARSAAPTAAGHQVEIVRAIGSRGHLPVTVASVPAGFGKSALVSACRPRNGTGRRDRGRRSSARLAAQEIEEAVGLVQELAPRGECSSILSWFDALNKDILVTVTFIKNPGG